jgi:hypothetical protein
MHWLVLVFPDRACFFLLPSHNSRDGGSKVFSAAGFLRKTKSSKNCTYIFFYKKLDATPQSPAVV